jgi:uncharacterized protein involved in exopolysaccharide biosynthesis
MTATRLPFAEPVRTPQDESSALIDWPRVREKVRFAARAVRRRPILSAVVFLAVASLGPLTLAVMPRTYRVEATLIAARHAVVSTLPDPVLLRSFDSEDPANLARDAILRRDNLVALAEETHLVERTLETRAPLARFRDWLRHAAGVREPTHQERLDALVERLEKRLAITVPGAQPGAPAGAAKDRILLSLDWTDDRTGKLLVETAARRFFERQRETEAAMSRDALAVLDNRAAGVRQDIEAKVGKVHELEVAMLRGNPALSRTYRAPRGRVPEETELAQLRATVESRKLTLAELDRIQDKQAEELRAELARERTAYGEQHPAIARTKEILERVSAPSPRAEALRTEIAGLEREFQRASERAARLVDDEDPALEYQRTELRLLLAQYTSLRDRLDGARVESAIAQAGFDRRYAFAVPPVLPRRPEWPSAPLSIAASLLGAMLLTMFVAAALDARSGRILERWQLERNLGLRVVGELRG